MTGDEAAGVPLMTGDEMMVELEAIGWRPETLADQLGMDERAVRRFRSGRYVIPEKIAAWLRELADFHRAHPPPPPPPRDA